MTFEPPAAAAGTTCGAPIAVVYDRSVFDDSTARRRDAPPREYLTHYEVERLYLTDDQGRPEQTLEPSVMVTAACAKEAVLAFMRNEGARLLGAPCEASGGDLCTAAGWQAGRLYVLTVWPLGHAPSALPVPSAEN
jgi:hypothetical protein